MTDQEKYLGEPRLVSLNNETTAPRCAPDYDPLDPANLDAGHGEDQALCRIIALKIQYRQMRALERIADRLDYGVENVAPFRKSDYI